MLPPNTQRLRLLCLVLSAFWLAPLERVWSTEPEMWEHSIGYRQHSQPKNKALIDIYLAITSLEEQRIITDPHNTEFVNRFDRRLDPAIRIPDQFPNEGFYPGVLISEAVKANLELFNITAASMNQDPHKAFREAINQVSNRIKRPRAYRTFAELRLQ